MNQIKSQGALNVNQRELITPELIHFARSMARCYRGCGVDVEDLEQEACYGLCQAALHNTNGDAASFKTFAYPYVKKYIIMAIQQYGSTIRLPRRNRQVLNVLSLDIEYRSPDDAPLDENALLLGVALEQAAEADQAEACQERVDDLMRTLTPQERTAVAAIYGIGHEPLSIRETAQVLNVQPERARLILNKALAKMEALGN